MEKGGLKEIHRVLELIWPVMESIEKHGQRGVGIEEIELVHRAMRILRALGGEDGKRGT